VTLVSGFIPFLVLSLLTGSFWSRSGVAVPLTLSPSILIGDSVLLPLFNGFAFPFVWDLVRRSILVRNRVIVSALVGLVLSAALNVYLHVLWSRDAYTGFIDPTRGTLSFGGWWHCAFGSLELVLVLVFLTTCFSSRERIVGRQILRPWWALLAYSAMSILDAVIMAAVVGRPVTQLGLADYFAASPFLLTIIGFALFRRGGPSRAEGASRTPPRNGVRTAESLIERKEKSMADRLRDKSDLGALVQLHVAEYNALTNRCTYRIYFQFSIWGILMVYFPLMAGVWNGSKNHSFILWVTGLVIQGATFIWQENLIEIYRTITYIEQLQRPVLAELLPGHRFWEYEQYLAAGRPDRAVWWEYLFPLLVLLALVGIGAFRVFGDSKDPGTFLQQYGNDLVGAGINIGVFSGLVYSTKIAVDIRKGMAAKRTMTEDKRLTR
jgi:hypothetical protein